MADDDSTVVDYVEIETGVIKELTHVRLYDETVDKVRRHHREVHLELPSISTAVENAVKNPTHIVKSYGNSYIFVDAETTSSGGDPLRVPIQPVAGGTSGRIRSIYFASTDVEQNVVWTRADAKD